MIANEAENTHQWSFQSGGGFLGGQGLSGGRNLYMH